MRSRALMLLTWSGCGLLIALLHPSAGGLPTVRDCRAWLAADPEHAVAVLAAAAAWLLAAWLLAVTGLAAVAESTATASRMGRVAESALRRIAPAVVRQAVRGTFGAILMLAPAGPALAAGSTPPSPAGIAQLAPVPAPIVAPPQLTPPSLDWPLAGSSPEHLPTPTPKATPTPHCVRAGDTLWGLAAAELPADAPANVIAATWQQIYQQNRAVIGADPGLLLPGQLLVIAPPNPAAAS